MKKLALLLVLVMTACFMFVACEKDPADDKKPTGSTPESTQEQSTPADTGTGSQTQTPDTGSQTPTTGSQTGTDTPNPQPAGDQYVLDASTLVITGEGAVTDAQGYLKEDTKVGIFTIAYTGSNSKKVQVSGSNTNTNGSDKKFTKCIKLQGAADITNFAKCIKIEAPSAGTLTWYAKNANTSDVNKMAGRKANLFDSNGAVIASSDRVIGLDADGKLDTEYAKNADFGTFTIPAAGTYYFGCEVNGINVYCLEFKA